ncbi:MAG: DUF3943 domain-containing protein [Prolixibacteraceae bacterium]|nr:DUF3943 domain-containing protein [Prolixibacteraceae bacterium]
MFRIFIILTLVLFHFNMNGQTVIGNSSLNSSVYSNIFPDTLKSFLVRKNPPYLFKAITNYREKPLWNKVVKANNYSLGYNCAIGAFLLILPESISQWNINRENNFYSIRHQYHESFTSPPVVDNDLFILNYIGHPYQGAFYYNTMRSQGANELQSSLFCLGQILLWEYVWEGGMEQPSIQDLIITPLAGVLIGEFSHVATIKMRRNGFEWYEKVIVSIINPSWVLNNNFKFN